MKFQVLLILVAIAGSGQACDMVEELLTALKKLCKKMIKDEQEFKAGSGCLEAFMTGNVDACPVDTFDMPQFPNCNTCIKHKNLKSKFQKTNFKSSYGMIENYIYSAGCDPDDWCAQLPELGDELAGVYDRYVEHAGEEMEGTYDEFCKRDPDTCKVMEGLPERLGGTFGDAFKDFLADLKKGVKRNGGPMLGSFTEGIKMLFGGDDFAEAFSNCFLDINAYVTGKLAG